MAIGRGINLSGGRIDVSPITQAAGNISRSMLAGAQAQAQGYGALGQGIAQGIQQYQQNKAINQQNLGNIEGILSSDPKLTQQVAQASPEMGKLIEKLQKDGTLKLKESSVLNSALAAALSSKQRQQQAQLMQAQIGEIGAQMANLNARTQQSMAQAEALRAPQQPMGRVYSDEEFSEAKARNEKLEGVPLPGGGVLVKTLGTYSQTPQSVINMPGANTEATESAKAKIENDIAVYNTARESFDNIAKTDRMLNELYSGNVNTGILRPVTQLRDRVIAALGGKEAADRASATEIVDAARISGMFDWFRTSGLGARSLDTPAEQKLIMSGIMGDESAMIDTLIKLANERRNADVRNVEKYSNLIQKGEGYRESVANIFRYVPEYEIPQAPVPPPKKPSDLEQYIWDAMTPEQKEAFR